MIRSADFPKENWRVIMADVRLKTKDKSNKTKICSKRFIIIPIKESFHKIQVDQILDRFRLRRGRNLIKVSKETTSSAHIEHTMCSLCSHYVYRVKMGMKDDC